MELQTCHSQHHHLIEISDDRQTDIIALRLTCKLGQSVAAMLGRQASSARFPRTSQKTVTEWVAEKCDVLPSYSQSGTRVAGNSDRGRTARRK